MLLKKELQLQILAAIGSCWLYVIGSPHPKNYGIKQ
jgi:hypothetical protein